MELYFEVMDSLANFVCILLSYLISYSIPEENMLYIYLVYSLFAFAVICHFTILYFVRRNIIAKNDTSIFKYKDSDQKDAEGEVLKYDLEYNKSEIIRTSFITIIAIFMHCYSKVFVGLIYSILSFILCFLISPLVKNFMFNHPIIRPFENIIFSFFEFSDEVTEENKSKKED